MYFNISGTINRVVKYEAKGNKMKILKYYTFSASGTCKDKNGPN
jgi:hypothetical protein